MDITKTQFGSKLFRVKIQKINLRLIIALYLTKKNYGSRRIIDMDYRFYPNYGDCNCHKRTLKSNINK